MEHRTARKRTRPSDVDQYHDADLVPFETPLRKLTTFVGEGLHVIKTAFCRLIMPEQQTLVDTLISRATALQTYPRRNHEEITRNLIRQVDLGFVPMSLSIRRWAKQQQQCNSTHRQLMERALARRSKDIEFDRQGEISTKKRAIERVIQPKPTLSERVQEKEKSNSISWEVIQSSRKLFVDVARNELEKKQKEISSGQKQELPKKSEIIKAALQNLKRKGLKRTLSFEMVEENDDTEKIQTSLKNISGQIEANIQVDPSKEEKQKEVKQKKVDQVKVDTEKKPEVSLDATKQEKKEQKKEEIKLIAVADKQEKKDESKKEETTQKKESSIEKKVEPNLLGLDKSTQPPDKPGPAVNPFKQTPTKIFSLEAFIANDNLNKAKKIVQSPDERANPFLPYLLASKNNSNLATPSEKSANPTITPVKSEDQKSNITLKTERPVFTIFSNGAPSNSSSNKHAFNVTGKTEDSNATKQNPIKFPNNCPIPKGPSVFQMKKDPKNDGASIFTTRSIPINFSSAATNSPNSNSSNSQGYHFNQQKPNQPASSFASNVQSSSNSFNLAIDPQYSNKSIDFFQTSRPNQQPPSLFDAASACTERTEKKGRHLPNRKRKIDREERIG